MLDKSFIPQKPFKSFKWQWASFAPTESINDPVVLLGVLFRMNKLEGKYKYNSAEFTQQLNELSEDINDSIGINLAERGGERNVMRNSQQYWKSLKLIPKHTHGVIQLTDFGRKVANRDISQTEFSAVTIMTHQLPNPYIQSEEICNEWRMAGIVIKPLKLILSICEETKYLTVEELCNVVIPLSGNPGTILKDYINFIFWYREGSININNWPQCCVESNDRRMAREFLLFLMYYGYLLKSKEDNNKFVFNENIKDEIDNILKDLTTSPTTEEAIQLLRSSDIVSNVERKNIEVSKHRPHQAQFRKAVISACKRCIITNVTMPEVLEAAHIKPYKYKGEDTVANGFAMRLDIHMLFDTGHLRISPTGEVELSGRARMDYGALIPPNIVIPDFTNKEFLKWRWDNYNGM